MIGVIENQLFDSFEFICVQSCLQFKSYWLKVSGRKKFVPFKTPTWQRHPVQGEPSDIE